MNFFLQKFNLCYNKRGFLFSSGFLFVNTLFGLPPTITSFSPISGGVGITVTIIGTNFSNVASNDTVYFGAVRAVVSFASGTQIQAVVPAGASYQPISVTVNHLTAYSITPFIVTFAGGNGGFDSNSFANVNSITGIFPGGFAIGDIDLDGKPDIVVPNTSSSFNSISILRNTSVNGAISFATAIVFITGESPRDIALGDFDGDGKLDIGVVNANANTLSVFRNTSLSGSISLAPKNDYTTPVGPIVISVADLNSDGKPEIIIANSSSDFPDSISVYKNTSTAGNISFAERIDFKPGGGPFSISTSDIDGDKKPDIVVVNDNENTFSVLRNTSIGGVISFANRVNFAAGNIPTGSSVGDLNGDGKLDIIVTSYSNDPGTIAIFKNTSAMGSISFSPAINYPTNIRPYFTKLGDLNGDGKVDIVLSNNYSSNVSILRNTSAGGTISFATKVDFLVGNSPSYISLGDLDRDGRLDIIGDIVISGSTPELFLLRNKINEPTITTFNPNNAAMGATVTIGGTNFTGTTSVSFGGILASSFTVASSTSITAVVGSGSSGNVTITTPGGTASRNGFSFIPPPSITSFNPNNGGAGTIVTIAGANFNGATSVKFGGMPAASFTIISSTSISAVVGIGATGGISVTTPGGNTILSGFNFLLPSATLIGSTTACTNDPSPMITFTGANGTPPYTFTYTINGGPQITLATSFGNSQSLLVPTIDTGNFIYSLIKVSDSNGNYQNQNGNANILINNCHASLSLKIYIQGLYVGNGQMSPLLFSNGTSTDASVVDSITVELHNESTPYSKIESVQAILHTNGEASMDFGGSTLGNSYYVVVKYHNAIETWSKSPVGMSANTYFDFTSP